MSWSLSMPPLWCVSLAAGREKAAEPPADDEAGAAGGRAA